VPNWILNPSLSEFPKDRGVCPAVKIRKYPSAAFAGGCEVVVEAIEVGGIWIIYFGYPNVALISSSLSRKQRWALATGLVRSFL